MKRVAWRAFSVVAFAALHTCGAVLAATVEAMDATGARVTLAKPAQRIISLSPHATELIAAAGAGARLVAVTQSCDFPAHVQQLPRVSNAQGINFEALVAARPDLVVVWPAGNRAQDLERLRALKIPMFASQPATLSMIADDIEKLGVLADTNATARAAASNVRTQISALSEQHSLSSAKRRVFYQLGPGALYTLNDSHPVMEIVARCGGQNIFGTLPQSAPQVSIEAVLEAKPDVIILAAPDEAQAMRTQWQTNAATRRLAHTHFIVADGRVLHRPTPRLFDAAQALCKTLRDQHK
jgi:iron complex transport system substrate-binding protein